MAVTQLVTRQIKNLAITTALLADAAVSLIKFGGFTTKGDLLTFSTLNARLPVGSDTFILTADSTQATGIKWAANAALATTNFVFNEVPSGTVNGVNATFTLANTPTAGTVQLYVNGIRYSSGASFDYTISTNTITMLTGAIPQTGDNLLADYMK